MALSISVRFQPSWGCSGTFQLQATVPVPSRRPAKSKRKSKTKPKTKARRATKRAAKRK